MGITIPVFCLMLGLFIQTIVYEIGSAIPPVIRQDSHVSLQLCRMLPDLYGCDPWVGALTSVQLWELSLLVGQVSGLFSNVLLVALLATWSTVQRGDKSLVPGLLLGAGALISTLALAVAFNVPLNPMTARGFFTILMILLLPSSGWVGARIGVGRLARHPASGLASTFAVNESAQMDFFGEKLSQRELEVLALVAEGCKNREIAQRLYISQATVKTHLIHIFAKMGVENRTAAVTQALAYGLLQQAEPESEP